MKRKSKSLVTKDVSGTSQMRVLRKGGRMARWYEPQGSYVCFNKGRKSIFWIQG